ncbi:MAG TPA: aldo/keto reductase [Rhizomicrobium sp.]|nr:aldo/keto reductase [Rhizomicrobium sp.]
MSLLKTTLAPAQIPGVIGRLGIGTVQFGQAYGISNTNGQVPRAEVKLILDLAAQTGIGMLDTAANYGEAEAVLGGNDLSQFRIVSKTCGVQHGVHAVIARVRESVRTLGAVDLLLVHSVKDLRGPSGTTLWRGLQALKAEGVIGGVGISAYVADDPVALAERFRPDAMQLPFSLLDQRLLRDGTLARLKSLGVEIHARSLFLQGLLFMARPPENLVSAGAMLERVRAEITAAGATPLAAALGFVLSRPEIDVAVVGMTGIRQLGEIAAAALAPLPEMDWQACALSDERILTPSHW